MTVRAALVRAFGDEKVHLRIIIRAETLWLPQCRIAELFLRCSPDNIGLYLRNIHAEGELAEAATGEDFSCRGFLGSSK